MQEDHEDMALKHAKELGVPIEGEDEEFIEQRVYLKDVSHQTENL